jgi:hypothetical protein
MHIFFRRTCNRTFLLSIIPIVASMFLLSSPVFSQAIMTQDPSEARFVTDDVELFIRVFNELNEESDTLSILQQEYLDKGSIGLQEFIQRHGLTAEMMVKAIQKYPKRYQSIGSLLGQIRSLEPEYRTLCLEYTKVVEGALFAPTYFIVGANRGIAQASPYGQLVSIMVFTNPQTFKKLMPTIIHELTHFQQARAMGVEKYIDLYSPERQNDLLGFSIREGVAEFVTSLIMNSITQTKTLEFYENSDKKELWSGFNLDVKKSNTTGWLWDTIGKENHLIAYVMGYKISEAYYSRAINKTQALNDLLLAADELKIFEESGLSINVNN